MIYIIQDNEMQEYFFDIEYRETASRFPPLQ